MRFMHDIVNFNNQQEVIKITAKNIVIYTQTDCSACINMKNFLSEKGLEFEEKNINDDESAYKELIEKYNSRSTPTTIIDGEVVIGFDKDKLLSLI